MTSPAVAAPQAAAKSQNAVGRELADRQRHRGRGASRAVVEAGGALAFSRDGRVGHLAPDPGQDQQGRGAGNDQHRHGRPERPGEGGDRSNQERSGDGAGLVECLVHGEPPAKADRAGGVRQQRGLGRTPDRFPGAFGQDEEAGDREPGTGKERGDCQGGHADGGQRVAGERQRPVAAAAVGQGAEHNAQHQRHRLTSAGDESDQYRGCAQRREQRPGDRAGPLIHHVGGQTDHPETDHRAPRRPADRDGGIAHSRGIGEVVSAGWVIGWLVRQPRCRQREPAWIRPDRF